jgi:hypothetical protein
MSRREAMASDTMVREKMVEYDVRFAPSIVRALQDLARRLSWERGCNLSWLDLVRSGANWVLASQGERPSPAPSSTTN